MAEAAEWIGDDKDLWQVWRELRGIEECIRAVTIALSQRIDSVV